jgi:hypothetical protein
MLPAHDRVLPVGGVLLDAAAAEDVQWVPLHHRLHDLAPGVVTAAFSSDVSRSKTRRCASVLITTGPFPGSRP